MLKQPFHHSLLNTTTTQERNCFMPFYCLFVRVYGISTIVRYLIANPLHTPILDIYDLVLCSMAYQPLEVI